ncbi:putative protein kinase RLK-Pelle-CrRLK1L-1 family [Helianthus annuus]|nr:putative protein kinase RLK-Pelle-CrRLK1L-1 family [Helianthus annuus]
MIEFTSLGFMFYPCSYDIINNMILIYEYMPNGSLEDHLHKKRANTSSYSPLTWIQRLNICIDAARGLDYLHTGTGVQHRVIHRDVKSSNILLDENLASKIADFGLSRITPASQSGATTNVYTGQIVSTFGYMDAEYFSTHRLTRKSDVYAFGVVLLEVLCGRPALDFSLDEEQHSLAGWAKHCIKRGNLSRIVDPSLRGQVSAKCLKNFGQIAYECLHSSSKDRPTMTVILGRLELVLTWTMQSVERASNRKYLGWSLFLTKAPRSVISDRKTGSHDSSGIATASQRVVSPSGDAMPLIFKEFTYSDLQKATCNFQRDCFLGEGGFGKVFKGWLAVLHLHMFRAVNEPNVQRTVREPFGGKFIYVRSISLTNKHEQKISFDKLNERTRTKVSFV